MAHRQDDEASDTERIPDDLTLDRRGALKLFGATAAAAAGGAFATTTSMAQTTDRPGNLVDLGDEGLEPGDDISDYLDEYFVEGNEVRVPAGEYEWDGDSGSRSFDDSAWLVGEGEVVLDIGDGNRTNFEINLDADAHVRIQNVTQRGIVGGSSRFKIAARDEDGLIEYINVNRPDGTTGDIGESDSIGFYVTGPHAGVARFINCHVEGHTNNGIYASSSAEGDSEDGFGPIEVYGGLYKNNDVNNIRPGSPDSKIIGTTCVFDGPGRGQDGGSYKNIRIRESGEDMVIRDCDLTTLDESGAASPIQVDNNRFEGPGQGSATVENCRIYNESDFEAIQVKEEGEYDISGGDIQLTGGGNYELEGGPYSNVVTDGDAEEPTREQRWYDWSGNSDGTGSSSPSTPSYEHTLRIETFEDPRSGINYEFTTSGEAAQVDVESNDSVTPNGDGSFTAAGTTGGGFDDEWQFNGELSAWSAQTHPEETSGEYTLYLDGQEVDPSEFGEEETTTPTRTLRVETFEDPRSGINYEFTTAGEATQVDVESNDSVSANDDGSYTATGTTGGGFDDEWTFEGDLLAWSAQTHPDETSGEYTLYLDGQEVDPSQVGEGGSDDGDTTEPLPNRITFDASNGRSGSYSFEVTGELNADPDTAPLESADSISGTVATGEVSDDVDSYRFSGDLVDFELTGTASVDIEDAA